jgi:hypothetical protein
MAISFTCLSCERGLKVRDELAGRKVKCPRCGAVAAVPAAGSQAVAASPPRQGARQSAGAVREGAPTVARRKRPSREEEDDAEERRPRKKKRKKSNTGLWIGLGAGGVALVVGVVVLIVILSGKKDRPPADPTPVVKNKPAPEPAPQPVPVAQADPTKGERDPNAGLTGLARVWTEQETKMRLKQLGLAYISYLDSTNRAPKSQKDLSPYYEKDASIDEALTKGWIQVAWGTDIRRLPQGTSNTILAYERDPDRLGLRWAVMADGGVERIASEDFEKKKAPGK